VCSAGEAVILIAVSELVGRFRRGLAVTPPASRELSCFATASQSLAGSPLLSAALWCDAHLDPP
jgi:hypothetical protein